MPHTAYILSIFFSFFCNFLFETLKLPFLDFFPGPWKHHLTILTTIPIFWYFFFGYFIAVLHLEMQIFPYLEMYTGPWRQYTPTSWSTILYFFLIFSLFYCHFSFMHSQTFHIWKFTQVPETVPPTLSILLLFFIFCIARLSIFGNAPWFLNIHPKVKK